MRWQDLSPQQQSILWMLTRGHSNDEIASLLGLALSTVRNTLGRLYPLLGVHSRVQAMRWVLEQPESGAYQALLSEAA